MLQSLAVQPAAEPSAKEIITEVDAPQRAVRHTRLGERAVQIQQPDQPRPFAAPVGDGEDRSAVSIETVQKMMAILPDRLDHHQRRILRDIAKNFHTALLAVDEAVLLG